MSAAKHRSEAAEPILHADMDAFFASVEQRDDPSLQGKPVVVGGAGTRGVVAAASYEAREFGIHSAMPMVRARRLCPDLVIVGGKHGHYAEVSKQVMGIFRDFTPLVEPLSLDEAFLDVAGAVRIFGEPVSIAEQIRARIRDELELPCSVGVAPTKSLAKMCSGKAKPDGVFHLTAADVDAFLRPLPVGDLYGAGPKTVERLTQYGFRRIGQIADADERTLCRVVGDKLGRHLHRLARGEDPRAVTPYEGAKSISAEQTFGTDIDDPEELRTYLLRLGEKVSRRLRASEMAGRTVTIKVRFASFQTITRSLTVDLPTDRTHDIVDAALALFDDLRLERSRVRLLGVGVSNLTEGAGARQMELGADQRWEEIDRAADKAVDRFGSGAVTYGALIDAESEQQWSETSEDRRG